MVAGTDGTQAHSDWAMNGGMWGGTRDAVPDMTERLERLKVGKDYRLDMDFLNEQVWPIAQKSLLQHDAFTCAKFGGGSPFPTTRTGSEHVGQVFLNLKDKTRKADVQALKKGVQPTECTDRAGRR